MTILALALLAFIAATALTGWIRRESIGRGLLDHPNARSSHAMAVPRGGGLAIVLCFLMGAGLAAMFGVLPGPVALAFILSGGLTAFVGWRDDIRSLGAGPRLATHFLAAGIGLFLIGGLPPIAIADTIIDMGWTGHALALVGLVWMLNLFNFMDGINGIAGIETVTAGAGVAALLVAAAHDEAALLPMLLAAAAAGFLVWNFPRGLIFMGDVGSGFLGLVFGLLLLHFASFEPRMLYSGLILLGVFVVDATMTLFIRLARGHPPHEAHRSHAYQAAARRYGSHVPVSLAVGAINLCFLLPLAWSVVDGGLSGPAALAAAYLPLMALAAFYRAGLPEIGEHRLG